MGRRLEDGVAEKVEDRLLVHLAPAANRGRLGLVGARGGRGGGLRGRRHWRVRSRKKRATGTCLGGCRGSTRSARAGGGSGSGLVRREREALWELGRLRRARWEGIEGRGGCLGRCCGWCESYGEVGASFYRPERPGEGVARTCLRHGRDAVCGDLQWQGWSREHGRRLQVVG
jgi:hypothetical protein